MEEMFGSKLIGVHAIFRLWTLGLVLSLAGGHQGRRLRGSAVGSECRPQVKGVSVTVDRVVPNPENLAHAAPITSRDQVVPDPASFVLADPNATTWSCFCGGRPSGTLSSPGGDVAELILGLNVFEKTVGKELTGDQIFFMVRSFIKTFASETRPFFMHTDASVSEAAREYFGEDDEDWTVENPRGIARDHLLQFLANSSNYGCGHLRLMGSNPGLYETRRELTAGVVTAFFRLLWDDRFRSRLMVSRHASDDATPRALLVLRPRFMQCSSSWVAPVLPPRSPPAPPGRAADGGSSNCAAPSPGPGPGQGSTGTRRAVLDTALSSAYVYNPDNLKPLRRTIADWLSCGIQQPGLARTVYPAMKALGNKQADLTIDALLYGRPVISVYVSDSAQDTPPNVNTVDSWRAP